MIKEQMQSSGHRMYENDPIDAHTEILTFNDVVQFLSNNRTPLISCFMVFACVGFIGSLIWHYNQPLIAEGRLAIDFEGIERGQYPDGNKFSIEDLSAPNTLNAALIDAGISTEKLDARTLAQHINIEPIIPRDVITRWKKQDHDGLKREDYFPNEFNVIIDVDKLSKNEGMRIFDSIIKRDREQLKSGQMAALQFISPISKISYDDLLKNFEYEDIPRVLDQDRQILNDRLKLLIKKTQNYSDAELHSPFGDVQKNLDIWSATQFETLKAMTFGRGLVKNKSGALMRMRYRLGNLDIEIRQKSQQLAEAMKLLGIIQKPQSAVAAQDGKEGMPIVDASVMAQLRSSDYMAPLVKTISDIQEEVMKLQGEKWSLENNIGILSKVDDVTAKTLPSGYQDVLTTALQGFEKISNNYNAILDRYLTVELVDHVMLKEGPIVTRSGPSVNLILLGIVIFSGLLSLSLVSFHSITRKPIATKSDI